ncbi:MAG: ABC transporter permease [Planctomycetes bacterium]|nr:ABC transporter permease [Planctomycetota bacterium]
MNCLPIVRRELASAFDAPSAWAVIAIVPLAASLFLFVLGSFFDEGVASLRGFFAFIPPILILVAPALTMKMWAEETRSGTHELLVSLPLTTFDLILGKFLAAMVLWCLALLATGGIVFTVGTLGALDFGPVLGGYLGSLCLGAAAIACGMFFSSLTQSQVVAWLMVASLLLVFNLLGLAATAESMPDSLARILLQFDFGRRFSSMTRGVFSVSDALFFLGFTAAFLTANGLQLKRRSWA